MGRQRLGRAGWLRAWCCTGSGRRAAARVGCPPVEQKGRGKKGRQVKSGRSRFGGAFHERTLWDEA